MTPAHERDACVDDVGRPGLTAQNSGGLRLVTVEHLNLNRAGAE
jgi:hypothetical protein